MAIETPGPAAAATAAPPFVRPKINVTTPVPPEAGHLLTLPDVVEFNATYNRAHVFCAQYAHNLRAPPRVITHGDLHDAVLRAAAWLALQGLAQRPRAVDGTPLKARPVAMLMASDVAWFITFVALLRAGVPVLCMSARLSPQAVVHLVRKTGAQAVLVSPQLDTLVDESRALFAASPDEGAAPAFHQVPSYAEFLDPASKLDVSTVPPPPPYFGHDDRNVVILHSSGTTGLPKPIFHSHAYLLGYAACHRLTPEQVQNAMNMSTLPLFHGFGLLAPSLSLSIGLPFAFPASTTIPTGSSTYDIMRSARATSLLTVPSILEELYQLPDGRGTALLASLRFVAVGGAPMKLSVAEPLVAAGVPLLNHWGVTEIGAIAPIMVPPRDYDWRYLRVRTDIHLRFAPDGAGAVRLTGRPPFSADDFAVQDLLQANPRNAGEVRIAGRADDLVVLATGEKVRPAGLEAAVAEDAAVRGALAFGDGRFQLGLLVETAPHINLDVHDPAQVEAYVDALWHRVDAANARADTHARVSREMVLVTTPAARALARTPKGSIPRGPNVAAFQTEIDALYARADTVGAAPLPLSSPQELKDAVRDAVRAAYTVPRVLKDDEDFFERGMDSLMATMLRRRLSAGVALAARAEGRDVAPLPVDVVYAHPSVDMLCAALAAHCGAGGAVQDRIAVMRAVAAEYVRKVEELTPAPAEGARREEGEGEGAVVVLTGSSGSLGSAMLHELATNPAVARVYALNRGGRADLRARQAQGLAKLGVRMDEALWRKVVLLEADLGAERFGLGEEVYAGLRGVTHVIHNAWPMDFNRSLTSFRPHLDATAHILQLALDSTARRVHVLFSSSIAVVGRVPLATRSPAPIPEEPLADPAAVDRFGYAEAKWVCEQMVARAGEVFKDRVVANSVRIGQMTGAEATGAWNVAEHFPMIVKSCAALGRMPVVDGDASWIPVNRAARVMAELLFNTPTSGVLHMENPARTPWAAILATLSSALALPPSAHVPYADWLAAVKANADARANPCAKIVPFLEEEFVRMATGTVVLDTERARGVSAALRESAPVDEGLLRGYVAYWRKEGFLG